MGIKWTRGNCSSNRVEILLGWGGGRKPWGKKRRAMGLLMTGERKEVACVAANWPRVFGYPTQEWNIGTLFSSVIIQS